MTAAERAELESMYDIPFDFFKEQIAIVKTPISIFVASGPNFNFIFDEEQPDSQQTYTYQSGVFWATVEYIDNRDGQRLGAPMDSNINKLEGFVRISVTGDAKAYLDQYETINFDNQRFKKISDLQPRGIASRRYFDCWLQKIDYNKEL